MPIDKTRKFIEIVNDSIRMFGIYSIADNQLQDSGILISELRQLAFTYNWLINEELMGLPAWLYKFTEDKLRIKAKMTRVAGLTAAEAVELGLQIQWETYTGNGISEPAIWQVGYEILQVNRTLPYLLMPINANRRPLLNKEKSEIVSIWSPYCCSVIKGKTNA